MVLIRSSFKKAFPIFFCRYYLICRPMNLNLVARHHKKLLALIWICGLIGGGIQFYLADIQTRTYSIKQNSTQETFQLLNNTLGINLENSTSMTLIQPAAPIVYRRCTIYRPSKRFTSIYRGSLFLLTYLIPGIAMTYYYSVITRCMTKRERPGHGKESTEQRQQNQRRTKLLRAIVFFFFINWSPHQLLGTLMWTTNFTLVRDKSSEMYSMFMAIYIGCYYMSMVST